MSIKIPTVNVRQVKVRSVSPLSQAQANQDITSIARWLELIQARFGPEMVNLLINSEETAAHLAKKFGVPDTLIRDIEERKQLVAMAQQMAQQAQQMQMQSQAQPQGEPQVEQGQPN